MPGRRGAFGGGQCRSFLVGHGLRFKEIMMKMLEPDIFDPEVPRLRSLDLRGGLLSPVVDREPQTLFKAEGAETNGRNASNKIQQ